MGKATARPSHIGQQPALGLGASTGDMPLIQDDWDQQQLGCRWFCIAEQVLRNLKLHKDHIRGWKLSNSGACPIAGLGS